jgi:putative transposase
MEIITDPHEAIIEQMSDHSRQVKNTIFYNSGRNAIALLLCLHPVMTMTTIRQFSCIALALLAMTGRVTMLGISRWTGAGGSYRTVQRFFATALPWASLFWRFFARTCFRARMSIFWLVMKRS